MVKKEIIWTIVKVIVILFLLQLVHAFDIIYSDQIWFKHTENSEDKINLYSKLKHYLHVILWLIVLIILIRYFINRIKFQKNRIIVKPKLFNWYTIIVLLTELPLYVCYTNFPHSLWFTKFHLH